MKGAEESAQLRAGRPSEAPERATTASDRDGNAAGPPQQATGPLRQPSPRPTIPVPRLSELANVPLELREREQWVLWRYVWRPPKWTKVPHQIAGEANASPTDRRTWGRWLDAVKALRPGKTGLGYVFSSDDPFVGIDLDQCRHRETGEIEPWAMEIVRKLNGYTEISVSGTGVHVIVRGELPKGRRRKGPIEVYDRDRFFVVTGKVLHA